MDDESMLGLAMDADCAPAFAAHVRSFKNEPAVAPDIDHDEALACARRQSPRFRHAKTRFFPEGPEPRGRRGSAFILYSAGWRKQRIGDYPAHENQTGMEKAAAAGILRRVV